MIHRPIKVNPDADNRLIAPNEARSAFNLRMGKSLNDTDLGITLVNGLKQLPYAIPTGNNVVIGVREDFETDWGYFALWNSNGEHGIWRTNGVIAEKVIAVVGFTQDMDVSIAIVDGKIYWTDNVNQPRMCNIAKGIANLYPTPYQEWFYTQIKRQPGLPLQIGVTAPQTQTLKELSTDYTPLTLLSQSVGLQYNYYYIYDNGEESRLGPWSNVSWQPAFVLGIPFTEHYKYFNSAGTIAKFVQFVYRVGNNGVAYFLDRKPLGTVGQGITNAYLLPRAVVSSEITNARFDSVPLLSATNEIAQNRLNHGNYLIDYPLALGLTLSAVAFPIPEDEGEPDWLNEKITNARTCRASGIYGVAVEICDEWGRTTSVVAETTVEIPASKVNVVPVNYPQNTALTPAVYPEDYYYNSYNIQFSIQGTLPSWAKYIRFLTTKDLSVSYFHKTVVRLFYWYQNNLGEDVFVINSRFTQTFQVDYPPDSIVSETGQKLVYTRRGYAAEVISPMPFVFASGDNQYIRIAREYWRASETPAGTMAESKEYLLTKSVGNMFMFETTYKDLTPSYYNGGNILTDPIIAFVPVFYTAEFGSKKTVRDDVYYQNESIITSDQYVLNGNKFEGRYKGDCYSSAFKKDFVPVQNSFGVFTSGNAYVYKSVYLKTYNQQPYNIIGCFTSMNPRNIYLQSWDSDIGQTNIANPNHRQTRRTNDFLFSDALIQGTLINGLSKFNSTDNRITPAENGPITALFTTNARQGSPGVLLAIGNTGVSSFYIGAVQLTNVDGSSNVASTTDYAVSQNPLLGQWGAGKLRNICKTPLGALYWWSEIVNDWIRYSQAGLDRLGQNNSFGNDLRKELAGNPSVFTTYDRVTDEVILVGSNTKAFIFSEGYKTLQPKRDYDDGTINGITPERGLSLSQKTIMFLNGQIYVMGPDVIVPDNEFFGVARRAQLKLITNVEPTVLKRWNSQKVYGPKPFATTIETENGLESSIDIGWWIPRKDNYQAAIKMASNTTGGLLNGKPIESRILITNFVFDPSPFDKINYIEILATKSPVQ